MKYKETRNYLQLRKLLATHSTGSIGYYLCMFMQTQFQCWVHVGTSIHAQEKHILQQIYKIYPYYGWLVLLILMPAKVGIKLVDLPENVFHLCMHRCSQLNS